MQLRTPVNELPEFTRYLVQRLKTLCPGVGKVKIAQTLARAGQLREEETYEIVDEW